MLVTTIPAALQQGATLVHRLRVRQIQHAGNAVQGWSVMRWRGWRTPTGTTVDVRARHYVVAGGAINSPALLLRSQVPDPHTLLGNAFHSPGESSVATMPSAWMRSTVHPSRSPRTIPVERWSHRCHGLQA